MRWILPDHPAIEPRLSRMIREDAARFSEALPTDVKSFLADRYGIDLRSEYGGHPISCPIGKASGQLSLNTRQVATDAEAGLGFVVLKTVIAKDKTGGQSMSEWAIPVTRMQVERVTGKDGRAGWTVSWKGRGWHESFERYLQFFDEALAMGKGKGILIVPSCKYHLPLSAGEAYRTGEYAYTTSEFVKVWQRHHPNLAMPLEKDFSPTLAGSDRGQQKALILDWLKQVPGLVRAGADGHPIRLGIKVMNAMFEDEFQCEMLTALVDQPPGDDRADFLVYANRLFGPEREFDGKRGIAYGGPDLSRRNLSVLETLRRRELEGAFHQPVQPISGTGDIGSGRILLEYALRGVENFQMHTLFQIPDHEFPMKGGTKSQKALHRLLFDPEEGIIAWMIHLKERFDLAPSGDTITLRDVCVWCREGGRTWFLDAGNQQ